MKKKYNYTNCKIMCILLIIFVLIGCNRNPKKPNPKAVENNSPKLPKVLSELEDQVLKVMYDLDSVEGIEKAIKKEKLNKSMESSSIQTSAQSPSNNKEKESNEKSSENKKENKEDNKSKEEEKVDMQELITQNEIIIPLLEVSEVKGSFTKNSNIPTEIDKVWTTINNSVTDIHKKWNVLESQLTLGKVPRSKAEEFEKILDDLTLSVLNKEKLNSLKIANELTRVTSNFRSYFDGTSNHGVYKMYYNIRASILFSVSNDYNKALEHLNEANKTSDSLRQDLIKKNSQDILQKLELSLEDLKKQLSDQNFHLSQIKAPIVIKNIKLIQDVFETDKHK